MSSSNTSGGNVAGDHRASGDTAGGNTAGGNVPSRWKLGPEWGGMRRNFCIGHPEATGSQGGDKVFHEIFEIGDWSIEVHHPLHVEEIEAVSEECLDPGKALNLVGAMFERSEALNAEYSPEISVAEQLLVRLQTTQAMRTWFEAKLADLRQQTLELESLEQEWGHHRLSETQAQHSSEQGRS